MPIVQKYICLLVILLNNTYLVWLAFNIISWVGWLLFAAEFVFTWSFNLFVFNHWGQSHDGRSYRKAQGTLDVFLTVANEPVDIFEATLRAAVNIYYPGKTVYVLDDGSRTKIRNLARAYGASYLSRSDKKDYKAGNMNYGLAHSDGEFILALDADQVVHPSIGQHLLGHFRADEKLAFVSTRQSYEVPEGDFNHDYMFYSHMQPGKNAQNAAISTGSGVIYRRSAIEAIGGFQTWNIVEDLYTSYVLHTKGYKSLYVNKAYTHGTAPVDLPMIYKQRGTWAADTMRIWFKKNPLVTKGLSFRQRLHYLEMCLSYVIPAIMLPMIFGFLPLTELLDIQIFRNVDVYLLLRLPSFLLLMAAMYYLSDRSMATLRFWAGLFPVFLKSFFLAARRTKMRYIVTSKTVAVQRKIRLVIPQLLLVGANLTALIVHLISHHTPMEILDVFWFSLVIYWFYPVIAKAFLWDPLLRPEKKRGAWLSAHLKKLYAAFSHRQLASSTPKP